MNFSRYWPLLILLAGLAGCSGSSPASPSNGKPAAELIESGDKALARGDLDQALADFQGAVDAQAGSARARERRAAVFLQMKKFDHAVYDCNEALKIDGKFAPAYFTRGLAEKNLGETEKALDDFTKALDNGLERVDVLADRGALYHSMAKASSRPDEAAKLLEKARKDLDRAVKLDSLQVGARCQRAAICLDLGEYESAVADCDAALDADPNLAAAHVARARGECELGEIDHAIIDCDSAIHLDANLIEAYVIRAKARLEKAAEMRTLAEVAECQQAAADCRTVIDLSKKFQGDPEGMKHAKTMRGLAHELRGSIYHNLDSTKSALAEYERALSLDPYLVSAMLRRAVTRCSAEDYAGALHDCNTAVSIDSARPEAYSSRGMVYARKMEFLKAIEDFTQAVQLNHKCAKAYFGRAAIYLAMESVATKKARQVVDPEIARSYVEKANALRQRCIDDATHAIANNRHLAKAYLTRGLAYASQQSNEKALADFNAAIREDPKLVKGYYNRGVLFAKQDQADAAIEDFKAGSKLQPNNARFDSCISQVYKHTGAEILSNQYYQRAKDKTAKARQDLENFLDSSSDFMFTPKRPPESRPGADLEPLDKAKSELEKTLDATAER
jgi:tetratricopeptide (TPR) repeat protein